MNTYVVYLKDGTSRTIEAERDYVNQVGSIAMLRFRRGGQTIEGFPMREVKRWELVAEDQN